MLRQGRRTSMLPDRRKRSVSDRCLARQPTGFCGKRTRLWEAEMHLSSFARLREEEAQTNEHAENWTTFSFSGISQGR